MIQAIKGTKDLLPEAIHNWQFIEDVFRTSSHKYGYQEIRTPIFERTEVFSRSIGEETDIVNKEMYTFIDKGGDSVTLRPEMTASIIRSIIEHSLNEHTPLLKLWYFGPYFRYERPQKGRLRQFHQYGAECIGSPNPESDTEIILLANDIIKSSGISNYKLLINTLGNDNARMRYRAELINYLESKRELLSFDSRNRLVTNPLRVLDSKDEKDIECLKDAPQIINFLDDESLNHFETVKSQLNNLNVSYEINPRLVRGLDYYCHTVFEFQSEALGAQNSFGGGGRYDKLFEQMGGRKPLPAIGFAMGVERLLLILEAENSLPPNKYQPDIYIVSLDSSITEKAISIAEFLRKKGFKVILDLQRRSMKAQFRDADKSNAGFTLIIGEDEMSRNIVKVKNMKTGQQDECAIEEIEETIKSLKV